MIKNNKQLITDWDELYMKFNDEICEDIFDKDCADEYPLMSLLNEMKDDPNAFDNIVGFFIEHFACLWHNNITGEMEEVEKESPEWYEGLKEHRLYVLTIANYFKNLQIEKLLLKI